MSVTLERNFTVKGTINCLFTPNTTQLTKQIAGLEVQLWHKGPLDVVFLGKGFTDSAGIFKISFEVESPSPMIVDGKINDVFVKVIYNNQVITGDLDPAAGSFD